MAKRYRPKSRVGYGYKLDYPPEFNETFKKYIRTRDKYLCALCQLRLRLDVHHIDYNRYHTVKSNCISLCRECHTQIHRSGAQRKLKYQRILSQLAMQRERENQNARRR